jgi:beta-lactamase superfamily II metal-dependent hydrolase
MIRGLGGWILLAAICAPLAAQTGAPLAPWTPGTLDIHHISTGRGNATFFILPDGTTLLVDVGAAADGAAETNPHPDGSRTPGVWIGRYIKRHAPSGITALDYAVITHFHGDHMGQVTSASPWDASHSYRLTGITEVAEALPVHVLLDRGWPDYSYPAPLNDETVANYRRFIEVQRANGMQVERFQPGSSSQIRLRHAAETYPTFLIRNIVANGQVWTGKGNETRSLFPPVKFLAPADLPTENMCSLGLRLQYGAFRYFTGGDLPGMADPGYPAWHALEPAIAPIVGRVDVHVVNQHGSMGEETETFLRKLQSTVLIVPSWLPSHPAPDVLKRIINSRLPPSQRYVLATDMRDSARVVIGPRATKLAGAPGHVVIRVDPGGGQYRAFVLENRDEHDLVIASLGPFAASGGIPQQILRSGGN